MRVHPFTALLPAPDLAARVAAPPYDVVSRREAAQLAKDNPLSFIHVVRSEIDLPDDVDPYDARVYAKARETLDRLTATRVLLREQRPSCYLYQQVMEGRSRLGVVGCVHVDDYARGAIKRHETTRPDKEDDRTRHILALEAHAEPVLLAYRRHPEIDRLTARETRMPSLYDFTTSDGVSHAVWRVMEPAPYVDVFGQVSCAYIADGHHRSASAWRAARERRVAHPGDRGGAEHDWFPTVLVPAEELRILAYNRVIADLGGQSPPQLLSALSAVGRLSVTHEPAPPHPRSFCLYLEGRWYLLELNDASIDGKDPVRSLDVALLQERVLGPLLGIEDQRTDKRIAFVGGSRGARELEARVDSGEAALAVSMFPTSMAELMAVSDAGQMMPPKSTWFEPKLLSGLIIHPWN